MDKIPCDSRDVALKSMFLGPQAENGWWFRELLDRVFEDWFQWRRSLFPQDGKAISFKDQTHTAFLERRQKFEFLVRGLTDRFQNEIPKFSPRYIGHMFSETSLPAVLGHLVALLHNPNNISGESSRIGVQIENEAIGFLLNMIGYSAKRGIGHFTSGGTIANFEALFRAKQRLSLWLAAGAYLREFKHSGPDLLESAHMGWDAFEKWNLGPKQGVDLDKWNFIERNPLQASASLERVYGERFGGPIVLIPAHKHYSWTKGLSLLGLGSEALWSIDLDAHGRLSTTDLRRKIERALHERRPILMVVSVGGTTELGTIDPIGEVHELLGQYRSKQGLDIWHHTDAAFGGFFCCVGDETDLSRRQMGPLTNLKAIQLTDSVTLDPHKMGYVPYSSGAILVRDRRNYLVSSFGAPYIDYQNAHDHGSFTIEGSRSAAGAVAMWMTAHSIGLDPKGYGRILGRTIQIKCDLEKKLSASLPNIRIAPSGDTNILCFAVAHDRESVSITNRRTRGIFEAFSTKRNGSFFVSKTTLTWPAYGMYLDRFVKSWNALKDEDELVLIRMCMMNPFFSSKETHADYSELFIEALAAVLDENREVLQECGS